MKISEVVEIEGFLDEIYTLKALIRYNNKFRLINESVAEHMYFVAITVLKLSEYYEFDLHTTLKMALAHDIPEIYVSDITHDVKARNPEIVELLQKAELEGVLKLGITFSDPYILSERGETLGYRAEAMIFKLADVLSVRQYTKAEMTLGNKGYMEKIYIKAGEDVIRLRKLLEEYRITK